MTVRTPTYLKALFENNDIPQQSDYSDIFDSFLPISATGKQTLDISLEIGGDFTASGNIYGANIFTNVINAQVVSASTANLNKINAQVVSASTANFDRVNANAVSASAGLFNIVNVQQVSASVINAVTAYKIAGTQVVTTQQLAVVQASGGATVDAEARTALNALITRLRTHGLIAS